MIKNLFLISKNFSNFNMNKNIVNLSKEFIKEISINSQNANNNLDNIINDLKKFDYNNLVNELNNDNLKKTFWINIYNSFIKLKLINEKKRKIYPKSKFFEEKDIQISNIYLSLDDIEHKILRKSQLKYFRGYLSRFNFLIPKWEKELRVDNKDYRVHFALNCGAKSCPPILYYDEEKLENQLELAKINFLKNDSKYDPIKNELEASKIFWWFIGDFGGEKGLIKIHKEVGILDEKLVKVNIKYREYNWEIIY